MYINEIKLRDFRTFREAEIRFVHADREYEPTFPKPRLGNVNLLLGNNGFGKTTLLKAISLACLGPAVGGSGIFPYRLIRREPTGEWKQTATIEATFHSHHQDDIGGIDIESRLSVIRKGDLEVLEWSHPEDKMWHPIYSQESDAFFFVGYGASRRVEDKERFDDASRRRQSFVRARRVQSLFEETYSLIPLSSWLPAYEQRNKGRFVQVTRLMNQLIHQGEFNFTGEIEQGEYVYERGGLKLPFPALSDGYRAFLGWVGDLLYHVCMTCPEGKRLVDNHGIVMVDEIDLHLHPEWQMTVLPTLAEALPNIQFIVTTHSPLIVGSLEWMNIIMMRPGEAQSTRAERIAQPVHGLDADQVLLTGFFNLESTRAESPKRKLKALTLKAREGDEDAARELVEHMTRGMERFK